MREQDEQRQKDGQAQDQKAEMPYALLQGGRWNIGRQCRCDCAETGMGTGLHQQHGAFPATTEVPANSALCASAASVVRKACCSCRRKGLARQNELVELELLRLQHDAIGWNQIAGSQQDDIAGHQRAYRQRHDIAPSRSTSA